MKKFFLYIIIIVSIIFSIIYKQKSILKKTNKKSITFFSEWEKYGKPVIVKQIAKQKINKDINLPLTILNEKCISYVPYETMKNIHLNMPAYQGQIKGKVIKKEPLDIQSGMYPITFSFPKPIKNNMITLSFPLRENGFFIPSEAIIEKNKIHYVFIVKDNKAYKKQVTIKKEEKDKVLIEGLNEKDLLIIQGAKSLKNGSTVNMVKKL